MANINIIEALEKGEIKEARLQGTRVLSIKYPGNQVKHFRLNSLVAEYEDKPAKKKAAAKSESKSSDKKESKKKK